MKILAVVDIPEFDTCDDCLHISTLNRVKPFCTVFRRYLNLRNESLQRCNPCVSAENMTEGALQLFPILKELSED